MSKKPKDLAESAGYVRKVFYSEEDACWVSEAPELLGCSAHGDTAEEALRELEVAIELYLQIRKESGFSIPKPLVKQEMGGRLLLRLPKILQKHLKEDAAEEGISVNQYALYLLAMARGQLHPFERRYPLAALLRDVTKANCHPEQQF